MKTVRRIKKMRRQGKSYWNIDETLNDEEVPTKRGGKCYAATVRELIRVCV